MGVNFVERLQRETGAPIEFIIRAFVIVEELFHMYHLWHQIEALDYKVQPSIQHKMMLQIYYLMRRATRWFLRNRKQDIKIQETIDNFAQPIAELSRQLPNLLSQENVEILEQEINSLVSAGAPESLARSTSYCEILFTSLDIVEAATQYQFNIADIAKIYYSLGDRLELNWLRNQMNAYSIENQWDELARSSFRDDLDRAQRKLSVSILKYKSSKIEGKSIDARADAWLNKHNHLIERWQNLIADIKSSDAIAFITYSVVLRELFDFAQAG